MIEFSDIMEAYLECRSNKRNKSTALAFEADLERNLVQLYEDLKNDRYMIGRSTTFVVLKPVKREVFAADFRDRVVHHWLCTKINPLFEREFIRDSYSCRKGKGTLYGINRLQSFIAKCSNGFTTDCYVLKLDLQGFFMSIDRAKLADMLDQFLVDKYHEKDIDVVRKISRQIAMHNPIENCCINSSRKRWVGLPKDKSLFGVNNLPMPSAETFLETKHISKSLRGLPIGNLTSQLFANFYLNAFDHFCKHTLKLKYYGRYVDDFVVVDTDKMKLVAIIETIEKFLTDQLTLKLHPKKRHIQHYSKSVTFLGARIKASVKTPGYRTFQGLRRTINIATYNYSRTKPSEDDIKNLIQSVNSYLGIMQHLNSYTARRRIMKEISPQLLWYVKRDPNYKKIEIRKH